MLPYEWITIDVAWGEGKKHLYCPDTESIKFYEDYAAAEAGAHKNIEEGSRMVGICHITKLFKAKAVEIEEIK